MSRETVASLWYLETMSEVRVRMQKDGLLQAKAVVGSRVFISQGPPIDRQRYPDGELVPMPACVQIEVEKNVRFASMEARRSPNDRRQE